MLPENCFETPAKIFTMLNGLNGLFHEIGANSVSQFVKNTIRRTSVNHPIFIFKNSESSNFWFHRDCCPIVHCPLFCTIFTFCCVSAFLDVRGYCRKPPHTQYNEAEIEKCKISRLIAPADLKFGQLVLTALKFHQNLYGSERKTVKLAIVICDSDLRSVLCNQKSSAPPEVALRKVHPGFSAVSEPTNTTRQDKKKSFKSSEPTAFVLLTNVLWQ